MEKINTLIWDELAGLPIAGGEPELLGLFETLPHAREGDDLLIASPRLVVTRRLLKLWRGLNERQFNATIGKTGGCLELNRAQGRAQFRIAVSSYDGFVAGRERLGKRDEWGWARGAWAGCGSLYLLRSGYYLALRLPVSLQLEARLQRIFRSAGILSRCRVKQGRTELMVRDQGQIVTCLTRMGLVRASLLLEEIAIMRSLRNRANKLVNCDEANINKSLGAARAQLAMIERIEAEGLWEELSPELTELARVRRENPSASLRELGQILSKPISKSTVEYRWKKIETIIRGDSM